MPYVAGVDLGTTYSAAAIAGPDGLAAVDLGTRATVMPSVVAVRADGEILTGVTAERRLMLEPSRAAREFKRRLGDPTPLLLGGVPYGAETLSGHLLRAIVELIAERQGESPATVGLSHPANYGRYKLGLLEEAARVAEIPAVVFVPEPVAAAVHYSLSERVSAGDLIGVYDLGGGTFDASVVRSTGDGFAVIGAPDGMDRFGGIDMDEAVLGHVRNVLGDALASVDPDDPAVLSALARLREECRSAKEVLSGDTDVAIPVMLPGLHTEVRLTRTEFEDMIRPRIRDTISVLERTVASAGVEMGDLARVLLIGGSSRIPLVGEMVRHTTGRPVGLDTHPKLSVALGTARVAMTSLGSNSASIIVPSAVAAETLPEPSVTVDPEPTAGEPDPVVVEPEPASGPEAQPDPDQSGPGVDSDSEPVVPEPTVTEPLEPAEPNLVVALDQTPPPPTSVAADDGGAATQSPFGRRVLLGVGLGIAAVVAILLGLNFSNSGDDPAATSPTTASTTTTPQGAASTPTTDAAFVPLPVVGPEPSNRVLAFYYTSNRNLDFDGGWAVWDGDGASPPEDICCDYYPSLGPYSSNDPAVLDQHFAWFRQASIGLVGYEWYGPGTGEDALVPLVLDTAERHGLEVAFVINDYDGRSVDTLASSVEYLYDMYGDHPAFYLTDEETPSQGPGPKGLFLLQEPRRVSGNAIGTDTGYWMSAVETIHELPQGGVVLVSGSDPAFVTAGGFDGLFAGHPIDREYAWATNLPDRAWYVPTVFPGLTQQKAASAAGHTPREDGVLYSSMWNAAVGTGVEPVLVAVSTFNNWVEGNQIEPAVSGRDNGQGFEYSDYGTLGEEGYLSLTADLADELASLPETETVSLEMSITSGSDWATIYFEDSVWVRPTELSFSGAPGDHRAIFRQDGVLLAELDQSLSGAEAGNAITLVMSTEVVLGDTDPVIAITKGCIGTTTVEVYDGRRSGSAPLLTAQALASDCDAPARYSISLEDLRMEG